MQFLPNILPLTSDRWNLSSGSMTSELIKLNANSTASVNITEEELAYIPKAFQVRLRHNLLINWKDPAATAEIQITYEDGEKLQTIVPLNADYMLETSYATVNTAVVPSKKYTALKFTISNKTDSVLDITFYELCPSLDLDDNLLSDVSLMLPQLVYKYNSGLVNAVAGIETDVIQLPVAVNAATNLMVSMHVTGECGDDTLECNLKIDGEQVKAFPVRQKFLSGAFSFGLASLIAFVTKGVHVVQLTIKSLSGAVSIAKEFALLAVEGKGVLGGASGELPHAEAFQTIPLAAVFSELPKNASITDVSFITPDIYTTNTYIPVLDMPGIDTVFNIVRIQEGTEYLFANPYGHVPLASVPELIYTDVYGMHAKTSKQFHSTLVGYEDYGLMTVSVDSTEFDPVNSVSFEEVLP